MKFTYSLVHLKKRMCINNMTQSASVKVCLLKALKIIIFKVWFSYIYWWKNIAWSMIIDQILFLLQTFFYCSDPTAFFPQQKQFLFIYGFKVSVYFGFYTHLIFKHLFSPTLFQSFFLLYRSKTLFFKCLIFH